MIIVIATRDTIQTVYKSTFFVLKHTSPAGKYFTILINKAKAKSRNSN